AAPPRSAHASMAVHCLTAISRHVLLAADRQRAQPPREVRLRSLEGLVPVEISFVKPHAETKAGLERVVEQAHVGPVVAVTLLHAQRIKDAIAARPDVRTASGGLPAIPDLAGPSGLGVELPSELADVGH